MIEIRILDIQPAFNENVFRSLVSRYEEEVFPKFFFPKNDTKKMNLLEKWLQNNRMFCKKLEPFQLIAVSLAILGFIFVSVYLLYVGISMSKLIEVIVGIFLCLVIFALTILYGVKISSSKLLENFQKLREYNLIDYHVEPYQCRIVVHYQGHVKEQIGYAGITDDGRVIDLTPELTSIAFTQWWETNLDRNLVKQKVLEAYKKKFGDKQSPNVVVRL